MSTNNSELVQHIKEEGLVSASKWLIKQSHDVHNTKSIYTVCKTTYKKYQTLLKSKASDTGKYNLERFMNGGVQFPKYRTEPQHRCASTNRHDSQHDRECLNRVTSDIASELNKSLHEKSALATELENTRTIRKTKLSRLGNIKKLKNENRQNSQKKRLQTTIGSLNHRLQEKTSELKRLRSKQTYNAMHVGKYQTKISELTNQTENLEVEIDKCINHISADQDNEKNLNHTVKLLQEENDWLRTMVTNETFTTYDENTRTYSTDLQKCVYELLNLNVSENHIHETIECVLKLASLKPNKLPCRTTINNMNHQRLVITQQHVADVFAEKENTCLLSDETSKFGKKYEGMHASDEDGNIWVLGIREMSTKAGKDILQSLLEILGDIDAVRAASENVTSRAILKNITSTMSDRAATQTKFNELLENFRTEIIKEDLGEEWQGMSENEQLAVSKLCNFFCSLHALVHMAETSSKALTEIEDICFDEAPISDPSFRKKDEPGTVRLVRTCCKAFARGGDEKSGHHQQFSTFSKDFLKEQKLKSVPLDRFRGNRFNILFQNAANVFILKDQLKTYLEADSSNRLLSAVKHDLDVPHYVAGCKALGLVCLLITVPLWCVIENGDIHITDSQIVYQELVQYLENFEAHSHEFLQGKYLLSFVDEAKLNSSPIYQKLVLVWEHDGKVLTILNVMIPALCKLLKRLFKDFLPEGVYHGATAEVREKTKATPKHNKFSESIFGHMDRLLREKPNASVIATEANIMFIHNKTLQWIQEMPEKESAKILCEARSNAKKSRKLFKERHAQIENERRRDLAEKIEKAEKLRQSRLLKKENLTSDVQLWGLWQSEHEVDSALSLIENTKDKITALKCQLNFRNKVLCQKVNPKLKDVYKFSKSGSKLSIEDLTQNVKKLARHAYTETTNTDLTDLIIVGHKVEHVFKVDDEVKSYVGQVISQVPGYPSWFNIKYAGDTAIYSYKLMDDYRAGDLKICV